jgi:hypothetical protein
MTTDGVALVRRFHAVLEHGRLDELDAILSPDCHDANPLSVQAPGRVGVALKLALYRELEPRSRSRILGFELFEDHVVAEWITDHTDGSVTAHRGRFMICDGRISAFEVEHVG